LPYVFGAGPVDGIADARDVVHAGNFPVQAMVAATVGSPFSGLQALAQRVNLLHATDHLIPRLKDVPVVASLMDAIPLVHPEWVSYRFKGPKHWLWRQSAQWAEHIVTISEHSRQEVAQAFGISPARISVVPLGVDGRWFGLSPADDMARVRQAYGLPERYLLVLGTLQPRKNLARIIAAHQALPAPLRRQMPLVVAGRDGGGVADVVAQLRAGDGGALRWLQYVPDGDVKPLLQQASALVFTSLHEGFGLPVLEAFAAGVPVVCSNTTAMPEVAGDAALQVNPLQVGAITDAMQQVARGGADVDRLVAAGLVRARQFSWDQTARGTVQVYLRVLQNGGGFETQ
jgi:alpha-1,3-rhamnosyl/mannosyltransferase